MVIAYSHAKVQGQRSAGSEDRAKTNGMADRQSNEGDCITCRTNAVGNNLHAGQGIALDHMAYLQNISGNCIEMSRVCGRSVNALAACSAARLLDERDRCSGVSWARRCV